MFDSGIYCRKMCSSNIKRWSIYHFPLLVNYTDSEKCVPYLQSECLWFLFSAIGYVYAILN